MMGTVWTLIVGMGLGVSLVVLLYVAVGVVRDWWEGNVVGPLGVAYGKADASERHVDYLIQTVASLVSRVEQLESRLGHDD